MRHQPPNLIFRHVRRCTAVTRTSLNSRAFASLNAGYTISGGPANPADARHKMADTEHGSGLCSATMGRTFRIEMIFVPVSGDQQIGTSIFRADWRREGAIHPQMEATQLLK